MNGEDQAKIQALVQELDDLVPHTEAVIVMKQYGGGCDESQITANETGYLRLGIELLKAPFLPQMIEGKKIGIDVDLEYLVSEQSDVYFHQFYVDNTLRPDTPYPAPAKSAWQQRALDIGCILLFILLLSSIGIGFVTIAQWVFR